MLIQTFESKGLAHYSYAVGIKGSSDIIVIDPARDIQTYIEYAAHNRLRIKYIVETHIHADFASGGRELAEKTGAELMVSGYDEGQKYVYQFNHKDLFEGDVITISDDLHLEVLHSPGHTPEHISFIAVHGEGGNKKKSAIFSGDFLFVGSVGRPDLLGEDDKEDLARQMYQSVKKLEALPGDLVIYPAHGAGSLCGSGMGKAKISTIGEEREYNPYLQSMTEEEFVHKILNVKIPFPDYYLRMKKINAEGPQILEGKLAPKAMNEKEFESVACAEGVILDTRHPIGFGGGHIEESINIGMPDALSFWASWVLPYDLPLFLVLNNQSELDHVVRALIRVGLDDVRGYLETGFDGWVNSGNDFIDIPQVSVLALDDFIDAGEKIEIVDVRADNEWQAGHIKKAKHIYLGELPKRYKELGDKQSPVFCICGGGFRSSIAASILQKNGFEQVYNVFGGMTAWKAADLPTVN